MRKGSDHLFNTLKPLWISALHHTHFSRISATVSSHLIYPLKFGAIWSEFFPNIETHDLNFAHILTHRYLHTWNGGSGIFRYLNICKTLRTFCLSAGFKTVYINNSPDMTTNSKWYPAHEICFFAIWGKCCRMQISMSSEFWAAFGNKSSSLWLFPEKDQCPVSFNFIWRCQENFVKEMDIYQWAEWMGVDCFQVMNLLENKVFNFPKLDPLLPPPSLPALPLPQYMQKQL